MGDSNSKPKPSSQQAKPRTAVTKSHTRHASLLSSTSPIRASPSPTSSPSSPTSSSASHGKRPVSGDGDDSPASSRFVFVKRKRSHDAVGDHRDMQAVQNLDETPALVPHLRRAGGEPCMDMQGTDALGELLQSHFGSLHAQLAVDERALVERIEALDRRVSAEAEKVIKVKRDFRLLNRCLAQDSEIGDDLRAAIIQTQRLMVGVEALRLVLPPDERPAPFGEAMGGNSNVA